MTSILNARDIILATAFALISHVSMFALAL